MKTLKLALVATLVAIAMVSTASADGFKSKVQPLKVINMTIDRAMHVPGLAAAMYDQIKADELLNGNQNILVAEVTYQGATYVITGTLSQWIMFFKLKGETPFVVNSPILWSN